MTPVILTVLSLGLILASYWHRRGEFHVIREHVARTTDEPATSNGPGGQDPLVISRQADANSSDPEFMSATLLPGRGFNLWQLTAYIPGHGEVSLLASPPVSEASSLLEGTGADANGSASTNFGGAFLAPFANELSGAPAPGVGMLQTQWQNQRLSFPAKDPNSSLSVEGLLLERGADSVKVNRTEAGASATAVFHAGTFGGGWVGNTEMSIQVELSDRALDLTVTAQNIGTAAEPFGIGWHPYFAIPFGSRSQATLVVPSSTHLLMSEGNPPLPTGDVSTGEDAAAQFVHAGGTELGALSLDESYTGLRSSVLADGPIAELRDPAGGYGLRITPLTPNIKTLHVIAPANRRYVVIEPNMNMPDPFGHEWDNKDSGMVTLQPGDSVVWKVRVEIFPLNHLPPL